jgi:hypothetical protein
MPDRYKERLAGSATGVATTIAVGTSPVQVRPLNDDRICLTLQPLAEVLVGVASDMTATSGVISAVPSGAVYEDRDYRGQVYVKAEGATALVRTWEV